MRPTVLPPIRRRPLALSLPSATVDALAAVARAARATDMGVAEALELCLTIALEDVEGGLADQLPAFLDALFWAQRAAGRREPLAPALPAWQVDAILALAGTFRARPDHVVGALVAPVARRLTAGAAADALAA